VAASNFGLTMSITRYKSNKRMSQAVVHGGIVYTAGQVAMNAAGESVQRQTEAILTEIDSLLDGAGTDKSRLLSATIWLANMADFNRMNEVWDAWVIEAIHLQEPVSNQNWLPRNSQLRSL